MPQDFFAESAAYDRFMGRWSRQLAPLFTAFAGIRDNDAVLDAGSGTGALARAVAAAVPSARITAIDPAAPYIAQAQERAPFTGIRFQVGDAQQLAFPDATFDRVVSQLVFNFIPDRTRAMNEMVRATRPGGTVAAAVWDYGEGMQMLRVFWDEAVTLNPAIASRDERHMPLCRHGELGEFWRAHGLMHVEEEPLVIQMAFASFDDYWQPFLGGQGPAGAYAAGLPAAAKESLRRRIRDRLLGDGPDGPCLLEGRAWAVRGVVA